jgi:hypothetical protein
MLPNIERADRIGEFWSYPESRAFAELDAEAPLMMDIRWIGPCAVTRPLVVPTGFEPVSPP